MSLLNKTVFSVLMFLAISARCTSAQNIPVPDLQVSVFNRAQLSDAKLHQAEARAEKIMSQAGVHLTWLNCTSSPSARASRPVLVSADSCRSILYPKHIAVTILERPKDLAAETFGQAFLNEQGVGSYIDVYYGRVSALGAAEEIAAAEILGSVIAHEIGHLELGADSHSKTGLMRAHWDNKTLSAVAKGQLAFSPSQVAAIRTTLSSSPTEPPQTCLAMAWRDSSPTDYLASEPSRW